MGRDIHGLTRITHLVYPKGLSVSHAFKPDLICLSGPNPAVPPYAELTEGEGSCR